MSFETALTGLNAASADLDVTGNNIANAGTVGFKGSRAEFADIFASSGLGVTQNAIGQGVRLANVAQQFTQGQFNFTGNSLDLAVNGNGFFRMSDNGEAVYSRNGAFQLDRDGFIVNSQNQRLNGFLASPTGSVGGAVGELQVNVGNVPPQATSSVAVSANLDSGAADLSGVAFDRNDPDTYNFSTSTTVFDSQGQDYVGTLYFRHVGTNQWEMRMEANGQVRGPTVFDFDANGNFNSVISGAPPFGFTTPSAAPLNIDVDFASLTQFGAPFDVKNLSQDGFAAGQFSNLSVEGDGRIFARFTNGQSQTLGQVILARFPSAENLQQVGDTSWVETFGSGNPVLAAPGSSGLGNLEAGALEQSNVNITEQLVQMITAQRNFSANSQMISTQDQITQEIINIR